MYEKQLQEMGEGGRGAEGEEGELEEVLTPDEKGQVERVKRSMNK